MTSPWSISTLRRIVNDLAPFQEGTSIPLDTFSVSLELVYRKLLAKQLVDGSATVAESEGCECVRQCLQILAEMKDDRRCE